VGASDAEKPAKMVAGSVFISYAHEDRDAVFCLADTLNSKGLEVWVDRRLNPGDDFEGIIEQHIRQCCAFVPVLSKHTQPDNKRWFRKEWAQARKLSDEYWGTNRGFLFPLVVDETPMAELIEMQRNLFGRSARLAPVGVPPDDFVEQLDLAQKEWRKQYRR
jgi:hypothetical protein